MQMPYAFTHGKKICYRYTIFMKRLSKNSGIVKGRNP